MPDTFVTLPERRSPAASAAGITVTGSLDEGMTALRAGAVVGAVHGAAGGYRWTAYADDGGANATGTATTLDQAVAAIAGALDDFRYARPRTIVSRGLPLLGKRPLTTADREALRSLARNLRTAATLVEEALELDRPALALDACRVAGDVAAMAQFTAVGIGGRP